MARPTTTKKYIFLSICSIVSIVIGTIATIDMYMNRFVEVELGEEIWCIECSAYEINTIKLSDECQYPVDCWVDPCEVADECQLNTPVECVSNYCGGCYSDFYDSDNNLVNCYVNDDEEDFEDECRYFESED